MGILSDLFQPWKREDQKLRGELMATIEDLQAAITKEAEETRAKFQSFKTEIQALKDQLANGQVVTSEQLDALIAQIDGISETDADPEQPTE